MYTLEKFNHYLIKFRIYNYFNLKSFTKIDSTNAFLSRKNYKIFKQGFNFIFSDFQTSGKGRYKKNWKSNYKSSILMSMHFRTNYILNIKFIKFIATYSILKFFFLYNINFAKFIFPNDIYIYNKKSSGVLLYFFSDKFKYFNIIIGIGLNINDKNNFDCIKNYIKHPYFFKEKKILILSLLIKYCKILIDDVNNHI